MDSLSGCDGKEWNRSLRRLKKSLFFELHNSAFATPTCSLIILSHKSEGFETMVAQRQRKNLRSRLWLHLSLYPFNSFLSSLKKRQSVPWARIFCGLLLIIPASCRRSA